ncbi:MAG: helix-turn-helix domain-containing protein [Actinobacteria bacterium]|nr:helix-turn-helix domain-containing protein [Actinomycetota bacterium]
MGDSEDTDDGFDLLEEESIRVSLTGIYDAYIRADQARRDRIAEPSPPQLEHTVGTHVVRRLDAVSRQVGFALSGLAIDLPADLIEQLVQQITERVLAQINDARSSEDSDEWLTTPEAAAFLKVSKQRLYDLNTARTLRPFKVGRSNRYKRSQLEAFARGERTR